MAIGGVGAGPARVCSAMLLLARVRGREMRPRGEQHSWAPSLPWGRAGGLLEVPR